MPLNVGAGAVLTFLVFAFIAWIVPLAAIIWSLITLARLRTGQQDILTRLAAIERAIGSRA